MSSHRPIKRRAAIRLQCSPHGTSGLPSDGAGRQRVMALNFSARAEGVTTASVIERLCQSLF